MLNGHFHGAAHRIDDNHHGRKVYQFLTDYQGRKQSLAGVVILVSAARTLSADIAGAAEGKR